MRIVEKLKLRRKSRPTLTNSLRQSVEDFERRELMAANFLQGVVAVGGAPLAGASVSVYSLPSDQQVGGSQVTGTDGAYLFSGLARGPVPDRRIAADRLRQFDHPGDDAA